MKPRVVTLIKRHLFHVANVSIVKLIRHEGVETFIWYASLARLVRDNISGLQ